MPLLLFRMHGWEAFRARALEIVWTGLDWTGVIPFVLQRKSFRAGKATTEKHIPERVVSCALYLCVPSSGNWSFTWVSRCRSKTPNAGRTRETISVFNHVSCKSQVMVVSVVPALMEQVLSFTRLKSNSVTSPCMVLRQSGVLGMMCLERPAIW